MKVSLALFLTLLLMVLPMLSAGCSRGPSAFGRTENQAAPKQDARLNVVTTLFPYYDFLREIAGDRIRLTMVVPAGMDSHSFEPTPADMITIQNADLLICNGGAMEQWLDRVLDSFGDGPAPGRVVTMMDYVDTVEEEIVEGMEAEAHNHGTDRHSRGAGYKSEEIYDHAHEDAALHEHEDGHTHEDEEPHEHEDGHTHEDEGLHVYEDNHIHDDGHGVEIEYDEHIWTSPVNAIRLAEVLEEVLSEEDPENHSVYHENTIRYTEKLTALDREFRDIVAGGKRRLLVFGDKFPLRYFFDEYGLDYRAAFSGCSTDTEPSAKTIAYLIDKVREEKIPAVYHLELSSARVSEIIGEETGAEPLLFHSCHNLTRRQFDSGVTYLDLMEENAVNLRKGLE